MAGLSCGLQQPWRGRVIYAARIGHLRGKMRTDERRGEMVSLTSGDREWRVLAQVGKYLERAAGRVRSTVLK